MNSPHHRTARRSLPVCFTVVALAWACCLNATAAETSADPNPPSADAAKAKTPPADQAIALFDGKSLQGWRESDFPARGKVKVEEGRIVLGMGYMTGITYTNELPRSNYEVSLEAMRVEGGDFFCGLTFPVGEDPCTLIVGGWGGGLVGLSCLDYMDAASNETTQLLEFKNGQWYKIRLRVLPAKIQAWIDDKKVIDVDTTDRKISIRMECEPCLPFGVATWSTSGALRKITLRRL